MSGVTNILRRYRLDISGLTDLTSEAKDLLTTINLGDVTVVLNSTTSAECLQQTIECLNTNWPRRVTSLAFKLLPRAFDIPVLGLILPMIKLPLRRYIINKEEVDATTTNKKKKKQPSNYANNLLAHKNTLTALQIACGKDNVDPTLQPWASILSTMSNTLTLLDINCHRMADFTFLNKLRALHKLRIGFVDDYDPYAGDLTHNTVHRFTQAYAANTVIKTIKLVRFEATNTTLRHIKLSIYRYTDKSVYEQLQMFKVLKAIEYPARTVFVDNDVSSMNGNGTPMSVGALATLPLSLER
ncbi:hypothetical protein SAMD00019534_039900 [Acytostelium subglobosum LB1]|uniref:hypothetical protein n=1 Tax=Acytostelium subglobosum LB1 TaxID=1410327 RepID=UPI000644EC9C|nr:hypothetical protein SAMD00019534_039900 [Acytostelium subglobosum LB1]GAM20815.1 hypothetical protein SAMD00019534_039900 [Acytostelium subglobosum LB1]|eukprot:XP_012755949.1 hypothetical protein SAMD00019534_039900 [Acytostelium subglobosum LB1]